MNILNFYHCWRILRARFHVTLLIKLSHLRKLKIRTPCCHVLVIGNSNMCTLHCELKKTLEDTIDFAKYPFNILADKSEIESFVAGLNLTKSDIVVLGGQ